MVRNKWKYGIQSKSLPLYITLACRDLIPGFCSLTRLSSHRILGLGLAKVVWGYFFSCLFVYCVVFV